MGNISVTHFPFYLHTITGMLVPRMSFDLIALRIATLANRSSDFCLIFFGDPDDF